MCFTMFFTTYQLLSDISRPQPCGWITMIPYYQHTNMHCSYITLLNLQHILRIFHILRHPSMAGLAGSELGKCIQSIAPEWGHVTSALKIRSLEEDDVLHLPYFL